ncbi:translocation protein SEC62 [Anopheles ziemanni]|uniref:translocation protein SEC62 n=1 Tax=Anopheles coustani TaxID=139045 RepID=UPI0026585EE3|nr:translocation protein SEC62 [Anopheles coustani]XP_058168348.1 translocation protein SEC62 [Anopheles ziemanni]
MAEKRRAKKRKDEYTGPGGSEQDIEKASKEEYKVAKWLKSNVPTKKTKFLNHNVEYFSAIKAVDALLASKFAQGDNCLFPHRQAVIDFMGDMLFHKFFHRARKVPVSEQELRGKGSKKAVDGKDAGGGKGAASVKDERATDAESSHAEGSKVEKVTAEVAEKRKRKIRLEMHPEQLFIDGHEAYVWLYDPIPMHYWIFGALLVVGAIVICLFPLWPPLLRKGVYYLSIAAAGFLVFILGLVVLRCIIFCLIWVATGGKHHFWLLPNLTEDVGFFASFWPLYNHEYKDGQLGSDKGKKSKKSRKRDKNSGDEEEPTGTSIPPTIDEVKERDTDAESASKKTPKAETEGLRRRAGKEPPPVPAPPAPPVVTVEETIYEEKNSATPSESDSEGSQRSSTGKDFEMVEPDEVDTS